MLEDLRGDELAGLRILIVDDEPETLELIALALRGAGAEVIEAANATKALALLSEKNTQESPHVIVSDLQMPDLDGYDLMRRLKDRPTPIPAIALSASSSLGDAKKALDAGFRVHLSKPISITDLIDAIRAIAF